MVIAGVDRGIRGALRGLFTFGITGLESVRRERLEERSERRVFRRYLNWMTILMMFWRCAPATRLGIRYGDRGGGFGDVEV